MYLTKRLLRTSIVIIALLLVIIITTPVVNSTTSTSRNLLATVDRGKCVNTYSRQILEDKIHYKSLKVYCFNNKFSCINYKYTAHSINKDLGHMNSTVMAFVTARDHISNSGVIDGYDEYLEESVCRDQFCSKSMKVDDKVDWALVIVNSDFDSPYFNMTSHDDVYVLLDIETCPPIFIGIIIIAVPIACISLICCFCCLICYLRFRKCKPESDQKIQNDKNNDINNNYGTKIHPLPNQPHIHYYNTNVKQMEVNQQQRMHLPPPIV